MSNNNKLRRGRAAKTRITNSRALRNHPSLTKQQLRQIESVALVPPSRVPKSLMRSSPFPPSETRKLVLNEPNVILQNPLAPFALREWRVNSAFDPDPILGGGTMAGFNAMTHAYQNYLVTKIRVRYEIEGHEPSAPLSFGLKFSDAQPSLGITSYIAAQNALEVAPTTGPSTVGQPDGTSRYRSQWYQINPGSILGNPLQYYADQGFSSAVTTNPNQLVWMALILLSPTALINLPNGAVCSVYLQLTTKFFSAYTTEVTLSRAEGELAMSLINMLSQDNLEYVMQKAEQSGDPDLAFYIFWRYIQAPEKDPAYIKHPPILYNLPWKRPTKKIIEQDDDVGVDARSSPTVGDKGLKELSLHLKKSSSTGDSGFSESSIYKDWDVFKFQNQKS
jgi:hypothetical protein